jgi:hypothetical protein
MAITFATLVNLSTTPSAAFAVVGPDASVTVTAGKVTPTGGSKTVVRPTLSGPSTDPGGSLKGCRQR